MYSDKYGIDILVNGILYKYSRKNKNRIPKCILNQLQNDIGSNQMRLLEYINAFTVEAVKKGK